MSKTRRPLALAALLTAAMLALGLLQHQGLTRAFDHQLVNMIANGRPGGDEGSVTQLMLFATWLTDWERRLAIAAAVAAALLMRGLGTGALWLIGTVLGSMALVSLLKLAFAAPRPDLLEPLVAVATFSYPSGHSANALTLFGALALLAGRWWGWAAAVLIVLAVGLSRVWLGVHWPSDVLGGWLLSAAWLLLCREWLSGAAGLRRTR